MEGRVSLHHHLSRVKDRDSFMAFVQALADELANERESRDPYGPEAEAPEQGTAEALLSAALAWARESRRRGSGLPEQPSWKAFASFLFCGKTNVDMGRC
jgi:hypothetical protein